MFNKINSKIISKIVSLTRTKDNYIIFESDEHHVYDNSYSLFKYLSQYKKLKLFYVIYNKNQYKECFKKGLKKKQIILIENKINKHSLKNFHYILRAKKILKACSLIFISYRNFYKEFKFKINDNQKLINLRHGQFPIKNLVGYYSDLCINNKENTYFRVGTEESIKLLPKELTDLPCQWFGSGMPRNDDNEDNKIDSVSKLIGKEFDSFVDKIILCMTTFKGNPKESYFETQFPIDIEFDKLEILNKYLKENNTILLIKTHHDNVINSEDRNAVNYSNILLKDSKDFENAGIFSSQLFKYSSALITDYSSVLFDYMYVDKPIGFAIGDLEKYSHDRGFSLPFTTYICGPTFKDFDGMFDFIKKVLDGKDECKEKRHELNLLFNGANSIGENSRKIAELFIDKKYLS